MNPSEPAIAPEEKASPPEAAAESGLYADFIMALRFFSSLPSGNSPHARPELNRMAMALPLASLAIGLGPALLLVLGSLAGLPAYVAATLAVAAMVMAGGAMAEDALADAADGLFGGQSRERRLEIMKDSRHGSYGVAALCLFLVLRVTALGAMAAASPLAAGAAWLAAGILARSGALWLSMVLPPARSDGAAAAAGALKKSGFAVGAVFALVLGFIFGGPAAGLAGLGLGLVLSVATIGLWTALCRKLVGGQTGDLTGALGALVEAAMLAGLVAFVV